MAKKDYVHLNTLVESGELGTHSDYVLKKFIHVGLRGKKLRAKFIPSIFGEGSPRGNRYEIKLKDIEEFKRHMEGV
jgi:hypothetical protein